MKVIVTGSCGFLGSHVVELFKALGWEVEGVDNLTDFEYSRSGYSNRAREYNYLYLQKLGIKTRKLDIRKWMDIRNLKADYIIHTAAQPTMTLSFKYPRLDFEVNTLGTFNILEVARKLDIPVSICSSVHVFGNNINKRLRPQESRFTCVPESFDEDSKILQGFVSPLHASKASNEIYGQAYIDSYKMEVGIFRLSGMYGRRQFAGQHHGWVSNFIIRALKGLPIYVYGTDKQVRDILHATDASRVFHNFYKHREGGLYVVGGGMECSISIRELLDMIESRIGKGLDVRIVDGREGDLLYFVSNLEKVKEKLGWIPSTSPTVGIEDTIDWIRTNIALFGMLE